MSKAEEPLIEGLNRNAGTFSLTWSKGDSEISGESLFQLLVAIQDGDLSS